MCKGWGGGGGANFLLAAPAPNQCQMITFLTLKTDNIPKLRIKLKRRLLEIPLNKIKGM